MKILIAFLLFTLTMGLITYSKLCEIKVLLSGYAQETTWHISVWSTEPLNIKALQVFMV
tara:strand:+ start:5053 stop:5229 length:177 start_codon:yes stop_codon:yes gene_type:complete